MLSVVWLSVGGGGGGVLRPWHRSDVRLEVQSEKEAVLSADPETESQGYFELEQPDKTCM